MCKDTGDMVRTADIYSHLQQYCQFKMHVLLIALFLSLWQSVVTSLNAIIFADKTNSTSVSLTMARSFQLITMGT